jgi:alanine racemase
MRRRRSWRRAFGTLQPAYSTTQRRSAEPASTPNCLPDAIAAVEALRLTISLNSIEESEAWNRAATKPLPAFVKIDVGALRGGVLPRAARELARALRTLERLAVVGAYAHLHLPDPAGGRAHAIHQLGMFHSGVGALRDAGLAVRTRMVSGTAGVMGFPEMDLDAVDPGRALFGIGFAGTARTLALRPVVHRWTSRLLLVKDVVPGDVAPFAAPFELTGPMKIGLAPFGWGDGLPRRLRPEARVLVRGRRVPVLPPSHFEHVRLDVTDVPDAQIGDEVVLLGRQGDASLSLAEVAEWMGRDPLHFLGTLPRHIERVAVNG